MPLDLGEARQPDLILGDGAVRLSGFALPDAPGLLDAIAAVAAEAPFRHLVTPGGYAMSVAMTVGSSRVDLQACKLEYSIVSPK